MSITVELEPEIEERLRAQAAARGVPVREYLQVLIRSAAGGLPPDSGHSVGRNGARDETLPAIEPEDYPADFAHPVTVRPLAEAQREFLRATPATATSSASTPPVSRRWRRRSGSTRRSTPAASRGCRRP